MVTYETFITVSASLIVLLTLLKKISTIICYKYIAMYLTTQHVNLALWQVCFTCSYVESCM